MRKLFFVLSLALLTLTAQARTVSVRSQMKSAKALIGRMMPEIADKFVVEAISPAEGGADVFEIEAGPKGKVVLRGNNGVSVASAFHHYLKEYCKVHFSWNGDQRRVPDVLPLPEKKIRVLNPNKRRVYFNYCTFNYSMSWWDWERWEREIDFMAINGINMPLAVTGLEGVWYNVLRKYDFTDEEARSFLVGPAYSAWQWMTNIQSYGGPLPKSWIDSHVDLGRKILKRQRELGMTPILHGFSGYVPREMIEKFPEAKIQREGRWCAFSGTAQLDPTDPFFKKLGKDFIKEQVKLFGTDHWYAQDPFHEGHPPVNTKEYLNKVGLAVLDVLQSADKDAKWVMQAWSIRKDIATVVPKDKLLILDLGGWTWHGKDKFWGYDFVSGQLHNFGGRTQLRGNLKSVATNRPARTREQAPNCVGMGLFPEAIENNPAFYNMVFDMSWRSDSVNLKSWVADYTLRRYGAKDADVDQAWDLLLKTAYSPKARQRGSYITARPALTIFKSDPNHWLSTGYDDATLIKAWYNLLKANERLGDQETYQYDLADVGRQVLSNLAGKYHKEMKQAFESGDKEAFRVASQAFLALGRDMDVLLETNKHFLYGKWVAEARSNSKVEKESDLYEWNATKLVTQWGCDDQPPLIFEYAWKEWAGLIDGYYLPRWERFFDFLEAKLEKGESYDDSKLKKTHGRQALLADDFRKDLYKWECEWIDSKHDYTPVPKGDAVKISKALFAKYKTEFERFYFWNEYSGKTLQKMSVKAKAGSVESGYLGQ
ncbi:alpha-N-acetylglucosaminidase [Fulvitalea axinellae]|uniref:Alpha-N-acetylglucosaminidase n=1 Tax=Fulvitalea axinellae TaxID=1182444 RepID=A0AAU9CQG4_9BACT|nr:alpha-N-acetylglucosaminidase [Fulvitalea axinellae]